MLVRSWRLLAVAGAALTLFTAAERVSAQGTITGHVTAQAGAQPLVDARIVLIGTSITGTTGQDGGFTLRNVPAGTAQLQVLRVGYQSQKRAVPVTAGQTATADFALTVAIAQLEEIVTTATGQTRRVELGNAVSTLGNVAEKVEQRQISNVSRPAPGQGTGRHRAARFHTGWRAERAGARHLVAQPVERADLVRRRRPL